MADINTNANEGAITIPPETSYSTIANNQLLSCQTTLNDLVTLNTDEDFDPAEWRNDGMDVWVEPQWATNYPERDTGTDFVSRDPLNTKRVLAPTRSILKHISRGGSRHDDAVSHLREQEIDVSNALYGGFMESADEGMSNALTFAMAHVGDETDGGPVYTKGDAQEVAARLARAHVISVLERQVAMEEEIKLITPEELGCDEDQSPDVKETIKALYVTSVIKSSREVMDESLRSGRSTLVWDGKGARVTLLTGQLSGIERTRESGLFEDERRSWISLDGERTGVMEDTNGNRTSFTVIAEDDSG
ncbi:hypothetical protein L198_07439 [Cryptococcus wingfieldii CBS 7118]|uniref:Uncharacterized protein n=1 Tax=Cryptococcus wingfieldii CBS 7118 TaxID=1295528 RepID=A0A1E3IBR9_9TREE|nr:hypothetical protein L198_07439 [Cryptococcus wingfieldii CBS 7118]ODN85875.1 hypothetical protein L198_07439 [Cryptococcus wingfieldii CBS 7118]